MKIKPKKVDAVFFENRSAMSQEYIKICEDVANDVLKKKRAAASECRRCYYGPKIGGAAITETECGLCGKKMTFSSTAVDVLCIDCAKTNKLCKSCGSDINSNPRRRKWITKQS